LIRGAERNRFADAAAGADDRDHLSFKREQVMSH
jgi:hypothetical protein